MDTIAGIDLVRLYVTAYVSFFIVTIAVLAGFVHLIARGRNWARIVFAGLYVIGLVVSIFQAATQINEMTLSFIPKLVAVFVTMIVAGPWMMSTLIDYIRRLYMQIPALIG